MNVENPGTDLFALASCLFKESARTDRRLRSVTNLVGVPGRNDRTYDRIEGWSFKRFMS